MSTVTPSHDPAPLAEEGSNALLYALGAAMIAVTVLACVLIVEASLAWLLVTFGALLVALVLVAAFIMKFIGDTDH